MLRIRNLEAGYAKLKVLKSISLHVNAGEIVTIIGANGAGKTTLLRTIAGIVKTRAGQVVFNGTDLRTVAASRIVRLGCSLVPEGRQVFAAMSVEENLILGAYTRYAADRKGIDAQRDNVCAMFPVLKERYRQLAGTLSGGEQQMLAIARALMARPRLIMLDEPSMGLAPLVVKSIFQTIARMRSEGTTILLIEQNAKASLSIADRGYVMETGTIVMEGSARELLDNNEVQRAYLGKDYRCIAETRNG
jgi:branched-chain amino acid transport system ATP-binding protein